MQYEAKPINMFRNQNMKFGAESLDKFFLVAILKMICRQLDDMLSYVDQEILVHKFLKLQFQLK